MDNVVRVGKVIGIMYVFLWHQFVLFFQTYWDVFSGLSIYLPFAYIFV